MNKGQTTSTRQFKPAGVLIIGTVCAVCATILLLIFYSSAQSPKSRLYAGPLGYPAIMRTLKRPIPVECTTVATRRMRDTISAPGRLSYIDHTTIRSDIAGIITKVHLRPGDPVKKGSRLLTVFTGGSNLEAARMNAQGLLLQQQHTKQALDREQLAFDQGTSNNATLADKQAAYDQATIAYEIALQNYFQQLQSLSKEYLSGQLSEIPTDTDQPETSVYATTDGIILSVNATEGDTLQARQPLFEIGRNQQFRADVNQTHVNRINLMDSIEVYLLAYPGQPFKGDVVERLPFIQDSRTPNSRGSVLTFEIGVEIQNQRNHPLFTGMTGYCLLSRAYDTLALPSNAIMRFSGDEGLVMIADPNNHLQLREVRLGIAENGWVEITSGLEKETNVVSCGQIALNEGDLISIIDDEATN